MGEVLDEGRQWEDDIFISDAVVEEIPEGHVELTAGLLEAGKGVSSAAAVFAASAAVYLAAFDILTNVTLAQVVVQRQVGTLESEQ